MYIAPINRAELHWVFTHTHTHGIDKSSSKQILRVNFLGHWPLTSHRLLRLVIKQLGISFVRLERRLPRLTATRRSESRLFWILFLSLIVSRRAVARTDGNVVSPVVCVNAAGKVGRRFPSRGTIHLQKFLEITSRAKAQWRRRREGGEAKERWRIDTGFEEKTKREGRRQESGSERERER